MLDVLVITPLLLLAFILAIGIGANDETFAPVVGARKLNPLQCVAIGAVLAIFGALTLGENVAGTVGKGITKLQLTEPMIFAILSGMAVVLILSSYFGLPISSTHAMVGAILGITIYIAGNMSLINMDKIYSIVLSWFVSPTIGLFGSFITFKILDTVNYKFTKGLKSVERNENFAANFLLVFVILTALSRGGNDVANAVSPLMQVFSVEKLTSIPLLVGGAGMAVGLLLLARRVLKTLANEIVELTPVKALSVQVATALITFFGASFGIPLSGTHILVASFVGVAMASRSRVNKLVLGKVAVSAVCTPIFGAILSICFFFLANITIT